MKTKVVITAVALAGTLFTYACGPCAFVTDEKACHSAYVNAPLLPKVQIGMTRDEVKKTLGGRDPDRREATTDSETWYYMSDYQRELMSKLTFISGKLTRIEQVSWEAK
jgi:outer membrane protein assembly factor BamE (lipoprotein component of BamABCDE complex)